MKMFEKSFVDAFRAGEVDAEKIDDYIEYWHTHETGNELHEFLGMTWEQYEVWVRHNNKVLNALFLDKAKPEMPICKMCGKELGVRLDDGRIIALSSYIPGNDYCYECQVEHCLNTNCDACTMGHYPDCEHLWRKKHYLEE